MHDAVPIAGVGLAQMNDVAVEDVAIPLVPRDDFHHSRLGLFRVIEPRTAVAGLYAGAIVLEHQRLVFIEVFGEGFKRGRRTASVILHQGYKTPQRGGQALPSAVVVELTGVDELTVSRKRPIHLPVTDAHLGGAV